LEFGGLATLSQAPPPKVFYLLVILQKKTGSKAASRRSLMAAKMTPSDNLDGGAIEHQFGSPIRPPKHCENPLPLPQCPLWGKH